MSINLNYDFTKKDLDTICEALTYCIDEGEFAHGSSLLKRFKALHDKLEPETSILKG